MYLELATLALIAFTYSLFSGRVEKLPISGALIFVLLGLAFGPLGLGWFEGDLSRAEFRVLVELTLALILFGDAATSNLAVLRTQWQLPTRMLAIGLPGAVGLGMATAAWLFDALTFFEAAMVGTMLAATDAALGKAVLTNTAVPVRLREGLNVESGLNDGLCVPFLLLFIALAHGHQGDSPLVLVARELGMGAAVGVVIAGGGAWLLKRASRYGWISSIWLQVCAPALAFACFALAQLLHGSGFIAAYIGGMVFGAMLKDRLHTLVMPEEGVGETMAMLTWFVFGVAVVGQSFEHMTWTIGLYAMLSLTIVRMVPVFLSLLGSGERGDARLFLGWFGPRGLASIVFTIMALNENLPGSELVARIVTCTVILSLIAHGISAYPLSSWIAGREAKRGGGA